MEDQKWNSSFSSYPAIFGFPDEWTEFANRRTEFLRRWANLEKAADVTFDRTHSDTQLWQRVIYFQGRLVYEEFLEILLLCGNGYGIGAQKILRGMYERAVTARYLSKHNEEVDNYLAFHRVTDYKLLQSAKTSLKTIIFSKEMADKIEQDYKAVKDRFKITDCEKCGTVHANHTWSKVDIVSMARESEELLRLLLPAYHLPTREFHSTMSAIFSRLDAEAAVRGEGLVFDGAAQRDRADDALFAAHLILLDMLDLQDESFQVAGLAPLVQVCREDFNEIWKAQGLIKKDK